jgi:hypothetical protein
LDAPGTLYHVMARGIDQTNIFIDDADRANRDKSVVCEEEPYFLELVRYIPIRIH